MERRCVPVRDGRFPFAPVRYYAGFDCYALLPSGD